jgi:hemerythrin superfamily protein
MTSSARSKSSSSKEKSQLPRDAIALLKADHRQVAAWFDEFENSRSPDKKATLAHQICKALTAHTMIEEQIFYPAFLKATRDKALHHEAQIEHQGAKALIVQIENSGPRDEFFDSKVKVLSEMIKHHVKEEEQTDGMFAEAKKSKMDLVALGREMQKRKQEILGRGDEKSSAPRRAA